MGTIDRLMRSSDEFDLTVRGRKTKFYMRTLGAMQSQARADYATARARILLGQLRIEGSAPRVMYMGVIDYMTRQQMMDRCAMIMMGRFAREAAEEVHPDDVQEPGDGATLTEVIEHEEGLDAAKQDAITERGNLVSERIRDYREKIGKFDDIDLREELESLMSDALANGEWTKASNDATLFYAVFKDKKYKDRYFDSPEDAAESDPDLYEKLISKYVELDAFSSDTEELKN